MDVKAAPQSSGAAQMVLCHQLYINGRRQAAADGGTFDVFNPATERLGRD